MPNHKLNFIFWGTPDVASETLEILKENGYLPSLIVTSPDTKRGRGLLLQASPSALFAEKNHVPYLKPEKLDEEFYKILMSKGTFDISIVVAYGKIIPENIIDLPKLGSINIHYSLLPKYRGASPVESAILNGNEETGVTIQKMEYKMDTGPIIAVEKVKIVPDEKAPALRKRLIKTGGELLVKTLSDFVEGKITPIVQNENEATYCKKIKKEDGLIDLNDDPVKNYNKFRAYATWPRTFFFENGKRIIITDAVLENNSFDEAQGKQFIIRKVLPEGKKEINFKDWKMQS